MAVRISPFLTLAQQYADLVGWDGDLIVHTVHGTVAQKTRKVSASDILDITEVGVLISWRGGAPTGSFIPWGEIITIDQAPKE